jgi:hypothetical protein
MVPIRDTYHLPNQRWVYVSLPGARAATFGCVFKFRVTGFVGE